MSAPAAAPRAQAFLGGRFVDAADARVSVMTHAFLYGTGVFEGIRAYWSDEDEELYLLLVREHYERLVRSARVLRIALPYDVGGLVDLTGELLRRCGLRSDAYVRPLAYKSTEGIGAQLNGMDDGFAVYAVPFGNYVEIDRGLTCGVSSWRRLGDNAIPPRAKVIGAYANAALAKTEAQERGYDEAIMLTEDGHVSEGSAENIFVVRDGRLLTPPPTDSILEGITRAAVMRIAADEGIPCLERRIDRTELYVAEEIFLTGTGAQIAAVTSVDGRPVADGAVGPVTARISGVYFAAVRGKLPRYRSWLTPIYALARGREAPAIR